MADFKAPKNGVIRLRRDPMDLLKQLAVTFAGLVVVSASMLVFIYAQGDRIDMAGEQSFASADNETAQASLPGAAVAGTDPSAAEAAESPEVSSPSQPAPEEPLLPDLGVPGARSLPSIDVGLPVP